MVVCMREIATFEQRDGEWILNNVENVGKYDSIALVKEGAYENMPFLTLDEADDLHVTVMDKSGEMREPTKQELEWLRDYLKGKDDGLCPDAARE